MSAHCSLRGAGPQAQKQRLSHTRNGANKEFGHVFEYGCGRKAKGLRAEMFKALKVYTQRVAARGVDAGERLKIQETFSEDSVKIQ
jgi:hypothetical protein